MNTEQSTLKFPLYQKVTDLQAQLHCRKRLE